MFKYLLWKEWHENLWKLCFCVCVSLAMTTLLFRIRLFPDLSTCQVLSMVMTFVVPFIYAMDLFAGDMSQRTIHLLFKLPVPRWQIFFSKILIALLGFGFTFLVTGLAMEIIARGRETEAGMLLRTHLIYSLCSILILAWFSVFGAQNRSEAASLIALFSVLIGWGIVFFWATICEIAWAGHLPPYTFIYWAVDKYTTWLRIPLFVFLQILSCTAALSLGCYRFVKIRRYL